MDPSSAAFSLPLPLAVGLFYIVVLLRGGGTYALGRGARSRVGRTRVKARLETPRFRRAERLVERFGAPIVAASFLTVGFQTLANLAAGVARRRGHQAARRLAPDRARAVRGPSRLSRG